MQELIGPGCTPCGLTELCVSLINIRFHPDLVEIGATEKQAVKAGRSAKKTFEARKIEARVHRVRQEQATSVKDIRRRFVLDSTSICARDSAARRVGGLAASFLPASLQTALS